MTQWLLDELQRSWRCDDPLLALADMLWSIDDYLMDPSAASCLLADHSLTSFLTRSTRGGYDRFSAMF